MTEFRVDFGLISGIYISLVLFGVGFNALTAWMEKKGYMEGFTSLIVAIGVLITLLPFLIFNLSARAVLGGFICSGIPMIIGSISRYLKNRERAQRALAELTYGNEPKRLAK
jgi:hypothetical protein